MRASTSAVGAFLAILALGGCGSLMSPSDPPPANKTIAHVLLDSHTMQSLGSHVDQGCLWPVCGYGGLAFAETQETMWVKVDCVFFTETPGKDNPFEWHVSNAQREMFNCTQMVNGVEQTDLKDQNAATVNRKWISEILIEHGVEVRFGEINQTWTD